ncbi:outer membrane beta-barrel family protein [Flavobacterium psychrophilum]|uniref:outer membrane beta-barrel family protein n=1 Tax=Flavobacterium psychrophilum TaxID=96345 RepID=UPI000B7C3EA3|nr:outer membrane beta-barrel family protein [Flavobacterium psychrophilum]SNA87902.1 TonB-dependent receptor plug [Flavobacterium psychrophilum]
MIKLIKLLFAILFSINCYSQSITYTGSILNQQIQKKEYIVLLTNQKDPTKVYSEATINNKFNFINLEIGYYKRCVLFENSKQCDTINLQSNLVDDIITINNVNNLEEVVIASKKPLIQNKAGILLVNVENSAIMSSGSVFEMLSKMPSVTYNITNNSFKLKAKDNIQIQIDGQTLYLSGNELAEYLKTISANDINIVEINSSPSSKYDATGNGGIINIKTKRTKREGFYAGIFYNGTQGKYYKGNQGAKLQYNTKKNRYLFHYINSSNNNFEKAETNRVFTNNSTNQKTYAKILGKTNTINTQFEHQFKKSNLLLISSLSFYNEDISQNTGLDFFSNATHIDSTLISKQQSINSLKDYTFGVNYKIEKAKSKTTIKSNYVSYNINNQSNLSAYSNPSNYNYATLINKSPNKINLFLSQIDYEYKIDSLSTIELGAKTVFQKIDNINNFYTITNNQEISDYNKSNDYKYKEWILGSYLQYNRKINKFDFTLGSRIEKSISNGFNQKNNYELNANRTNFFPFANIEYSYSDNSNCNLSYSKRINRPSFKKLMPFEYYVDPYTKLLGNPNLTPYISHQLEFQYILKQKFIFGADYSYNQNQIFQTPIQNNQTLETVLTPINIKKGYSFSINSNLTFDFTKWWNFNVNAQLFYDNINSNTNNLNINRSIWAHQITTTNQLKLPKNYKLEFSSDYISPTIQGSYKTNSIFSINTSISNTFFNKKLNVSLVANDILNTYKVVNNSIVEGVTSNIKQTFDTRWIRLSLVYKFYSGIKKDNRPADELTNEIKSRIK